MTAEDSQPNELLKKSKNKNAAPAVRASQLPKWHATYKRMHRIDTKRRPYSQRQAFALPGPSRDTNIIPNPSQPRQADSSSTHKAYRDYPSPASSFLRASGDDYRRINAARSASLLPPSTTPASPHVSEPRRGISGVRTDTTLFDPISSHRSGGAHVAKRRLREWETVSSRLPKLRDKKQARKCNEMRVELPPQCRKDAFERSHFKAHYLAQLCDGLKQTINAEIVQHQFTDTQLIFTYLIPDTLEDCKSNVASGSDLVLEDLYQAISSSPFAAEDLNAPFSANTPSQISSSRCIKSTTNVVNMPSGSDVTLEDQYTRASLLNANWRVSNYLSSTPREVIKSNDSGLNSVIARARDVTFVPRQLSNRSRRFRSGTVTLLYGPPKSYASIISPHKEHASLPPEVIEITDTPPLSPQVEVETSLVSRAATPKDEAPRTPPAIDGGDLSDEGSALNPNSRTGTVLAEEMSTVLHLPRSSGDKPRRILVSHAQDMLYSTTMHGFVHGVDKKSKSYIRELYAPPDVEKHSVDDVSLFAPPFDGVAVVAQAHEENAVSLLYLEGDRTRRMVPIPRVSSDQDRRRRGVSAVTTLPTSGSRLSFVSAGYDHVIHLWSFDLDATFEQPPVAGMLDIHHTSLVQSLLSVGDRLISGGADNSLRIWDLRAAESISTIRTSNSVYQLHRTENLDIVLIELGHRDLQFELHDCRLSAEGRPPLRFGYSSTHGPHGRYTRGAVDPCGWSTFASGGRDGIIRLWDLRNVKRCKQELSCLPGQKIVHAAFARDDLVVVSDANQLLFFNYA